MAAKEIVKPEVGMGATEIAFSDCRAYTIISISPSARIITLRRDIATLLNGVDSGESDALVCHPGGFAAHISGTQRYKYEKDLDGLKRKATLRKDGGYGMVGSSRSNVFFGYRHEHYDYNF